MKQRNEWQFNNLQKATFDPLLKCLVILSKLYHKPLTGPALVAGLPLVDNRLTPELFVRAAEKIDLSGHVIPYALKDLNKTLLPAVLLLKNQSACVITEVHDGHATIIQPEAGEGTREITLAELDQVFSEKMIFVSPIYRFDKRAEDPSAPKPKRWFWGVIARAWPIYSEVLVASFLINVFALASPLFIMNVYDRVVPNNSQSTLWVLASGIFIVLIFDFVMRMLRGYFIDSAGKNIDIMLSRHVFKQLLDVQMAVRPGSVGTLANTVHAFEAFRDFITSATINVVVDLPFVVLFIAVIAILGGTLAFIPLVAIPIVLLLGVLVQIPLNELVRQSFKHAAEKQAVLIETLSSIETIKGMHAEGPVQNRWETIMNAASKVGIKLRILGSLGMNFSLFAQQLTLVALVVFGVTTITEGKLTVGGLIACSILTTRALTPITQLAGLLARYYQSKSAIEAIDKIMRLEVERPDDKVFLHRARLEGAIEFRDVNFTYPGQPIPALSNISFKLSPGDKLGLIGATGSGKSTIEKLILKFYEPASGNILLDGSEIQQLDPAELRHSIGYVPQDVILFHGTIRDNIVVGAPYVDDDAILRAAKISGVFNFVADHPEGFNRQVGERGQNLSAGQRQAISIARALLLDPSILVFDEMNSAMDDRTSQQLIEQLRTILPNKTVILVTHRASMLNLVDRLAIIDSGHLIAAGPKDEVLKNLAENKIRVQSYGS